MDEKGMDIKLVDVATVISHWHLPEVASWMREKGFDVRFWHDSTEYGLEIADNCPAFMEYRLRCE